MLVLNDLKPVKTESLKEICAHRLEALILSGTLSAGEKLPPERELAQQLGVSRPVVHEALVDMAAKGLVSLIPRVGTVVNDYRKKGSIALLTSLLNYQQGKLAPRLLEGLLAMRLLIEVENARLAALNRSADQVRQMQELIQLEEETDPRDLDRLTSLDFDFHHLVAMASENLSYPLLLNSFKPVYTNLSSQFFHDPQVLPTVVAGHHELADAIADKDAQRAMAAMRQLLIHGEERLRAIIAKP